MVGNSDQMCFQLECLFAGAFGETYNTALRGGAEEPLYQPAEESGQAHSLYYRENYPASALHEISHWCLAGGKRRELVDFGYWYQPDGRSDQQQKEFEQVEVKPQALEWIFSEAAGLKFSISADNLSGGMGASVQFESDICQQAQFWCQNSLPERAGQFLRMLIADFGVVSHSAVLSADHYGRISEGSTQTIVALFDVVAAKT